MPLTLTEAWIASLAGTDTAIAEGRGLIRKGAYRAYARNEDGTLVFAQCQGTDNNPYRVVIDLGASDKPIVGCSCPSRRSPCKHAVGLMLAFAAKGAEFKVGVVPDEVQKQRDRLVDRASRPAPAPRTRTTDRVALARKTEQQRAALEVLETFLVDLAARGLGSLDATDIEAIESQAARMGDADLAGVRYLLLRMGALAAPQGQFDEHGAVPAFIRDLPVETRRAMTVDVLTRLWATVVRGRRALAAKVAESESPGESDAQVESVLGRKWQLTELRDIGHWTTGRTLVELAHERHDDDLAEAVVTTGWLLDLGDGSVHHERTILPYRALHAPDAKHRVSREGVLDVREAALYPGAGLNRRLRWAEEAVTERPRNADDLVRMAELAQRLGPALRAYQQVLANPLAVREGVVWVRASRFATVGERVVMQDPEGARLAFGDPPDAQHATTANLRRAAMAFHSACVAVRLWMDPGRSAVFGQPLALLASEQHVRLGI